MVGSEIKNVSSIRSLDLTPTSNVAKEGVSHEAALSNAPAVENDGFKVPRVIE